MADKQRSEASQENLLQNKIQDLNTKYNEAELKQLLSEHGLDKIPLASHSRTVLLKKLAQKMLTFDTGQHTAVSSDQPNMILVKPSSNTLQDNKPMSQEKPHSTDTADIHRTLVEAKELLSSVLNESSKTHYVVCIPNLSNTITVYSNFRDVLKLMKEHKNHNPRMLSFPSLADAEAFASKHTAYEVCQGATIKSNFPQEKAEVELAELKLFPSLTTPQLNEFRIYLERGNICAALERILSNPRYLVQSIDMPTILKEGPRYNALHASVIAGQLESCRLVMEMISDVEYLKRLYDTQKKAEENSKRLIDLYLNTPDKVANKTPLHLASERGYVEIVAFLVSFKVCIRNFNRHIVEMVQQGEKHVEKILITGDTPEQVACSRYHGPNMASVKAKIIDLIRGGTCYVPLIRSDTTGPYAKVGDPYTPTTPYKLVSEIEEVLKPSPASDLDTDTKDFRNMKVWAFAGPMSPREAENFRKEWRSPRVTKSNHSIRENLKILDGDRGFERFGRELADCRSTSWQEYWPFLDAFADLRSEEGLAKLNLYFQKQEVINLMSALLRKEDFITAKPYRISEEYVLIKDLSNSDESEEENEMYFSAESPSCSEEDVLDGSDANTKSVEGTRENSVPASPAKSSGGIFSSVWSGVIKLKNMLSPSFGRSKRNINTEDSSATNTQSSKPSADCLNSGPCKNNSETNNDAGILNSSTVNDLNENNTSDSCTHTHSENIQVNKDVGLCFADACKTDPAQQDITTDPDKAGALSHPSCEIPEHTCSKSQKDVETSKQTLNGHENVTCQTNSLSNTDLNVPTEAESELPHTPDRWRYRTQQIQSPESESESPEKRSPGCSSPPCFDKDSRAETYVRISGNSKVCPENKTASSLVTPTGAQLEESFNTKMNTFSTKLENFALLSPGTPLSMSAATTPSSETSSKNDSDVEPVVHIFAGKLFSKFVTELKYKKLTDFTKFKCEDSTELPTIFLRQVDGSNMVSADVYLPGKQNTEDLLSQSQILDEDNHKDAVKNIWLNFLVIFSTVQDAKRISGLSRDEIVTAVIEGIPENKDVYNMSSYSRVDDQGSLKELFMKNRESLCESKDSVTLSARLVRSSTLPSKDVFICGTIPTKVDADVYHTLNNKACQLISQQADRFCYVSQWYDKMNMRGKDCIDSLPSPSRILRSEKREPPPVSPLVATPLRSNTDKPVMRNVTSVTTTGEKSDSLVRNLFGQGYKKDIDGGDK